MTTKEPKEKRIEQILDAAVSEFLDRGYEGTSMQSIARRAGLTKGGVYHHFSGKDQILQAANDLFQRPIDQLAALAKTRPSALQGLREFIRGYIEHWGSHSREIAFVFLSLSKILAVAELWPILGDYYERTLLDYQYQLERAVAQGELKPHDSRGRALAIMAALDGVTPYLVTAGAELDTEAVAQKLEDALLEGIRVHEQTKPREEVHQDGSP